MINRIYQLLIIISLVFLISQQALALTVTTASDSVNSSDGLISLREAITEANNTPGTDTIVFSSGLIGQTINLTNGQLSITDDLTIHGLGSAYLTLNALQNGRVLFVSDGNPSNFINVQVDGMTMTGGMVNAMYVGGGGILNSENLSLADCIIQGNRVGFLGDGGAGIRNTAGILTITDSRITDNRSDGTALQLGGGGILSDSGTITLENTTVSGNSATVYGGGIHIWDGSVKIINGVIQGNSVTTNGQGGGIANTNGNVTLKRSTVTQNIAYDLTVASRYGYGGGIYNSGSMTILESTVSSNTIRAGYGETVAGGGITNFGTLFIVGTTIRDNFASKWSTLGQAYYGGIYNGNKLTMVNSTISGNVASDGVGGIASFNVLDMRNCTVSDNHEILTRVNAGGVLFQGTFTLANSIVANSFGGVDLYNYKAGGRSGTLLLRGVNLVEDGSVAGVLTGDPKLSPLQDNGGPTFTHIPLTGSSAIGAGLYGAIPLDTVDLDGDGNFAEPIPFDQRGAGYQRVAEGAVDLGAVEAQPFPYDLAVTKVGTGRGAVTSIPSGIDCGNTCSAPYGNGTRITLTATPDANSTFTGWSGSCVGTGACMVTMDAVKNVVATFSASTFPANIVLHLKPGFNLLAIPADLTSSPNLWTDWMPVIGDASQIEKVRVYDHKTGSFLTFVPDKAPTEDYTLTGGEALIVYAKTEKTVTFSSQLCKTSALHNGFNLIGISCPASGYSAFDFLNEMGINTVSSIQRYSIKTGAFETASFGSDNSPVGINFPIIPGEGYFVITK